MPLAMHALSALAKAPSRSSYASASFRVILLLTLAIGDVGLAAGCKANDAGKGDFAFECIFPFSYQGKTYDSCTTAKHNTPWCRIEGFEGDWGECESNCRRSPSTLEPTKQPSLAPETPEPSKEPTIAPQTPEPTNQQTIETTPDADTCLADTTGNGKFDRLCIFPFLYRGDRYYECITLENDRPWCAISDGVWGNCALSSACPVMQIPNTTREPTLSFPATSEPVPSPAPSARATTEPSSRPSDAPAPAPSSKPTEPQTHEPSLSPTDKPTNGPSPLPTPSPSSNSPTTLPTFLVYLPPTPVLLPTLAPTLTTPPTLYASPTSPPSPPANSPTADFPGTKPISPPTVSPANQSTDYPTNGPFQQDYGPSGFDGTPSVSLSPMLVHFLIDEGNRRSLLDSRKDELVGIMQSHLFDKYTAALLESNQTVSAIKLDAINEQIIGNDTIVIAEQILGRIYFSRSVSDLPTQRSLDNITKVALESDEFLQHLQGATDPLLSRTKQVTVQFTGLTDGKTESSGDGRSNTVALAIVSSVAAVLLFSLILGYILIVYPRHQIKQESDTPRTMNSNEGFGNDAPQDAPVHGGAVEESTYTYLKDEYSVSIAGSMAASMVGSFSYCIPENDIECEGGEINENPSDFVQFDFGEDEDLQPHLDGQETSLTEERLKCLDASHLKEESGTDMSGFVGSRFNNVLQMDESSIGKSIDASPIKPACFRELWQEEANSPSSYKQTPQKTPQKRLSEMSTPDTRDWEEKYGIPHSSPEGDKENMNRSVTPSEKEEIRRNFFSGGDQNKENTNLSTMPSDVELTTTYCSSNEDGSKDAIDTSFAPKDNIEWA